MHVSVVVCAHTTDRYPYLREAVESVLANTYPDRDVVVVSDGDDAVTERARDDFGDHDDIHVIELPENRGLLAARNAGAEHAIEHTNSDVVAFIDDDAVADERWIEELVTAYQQYEAEDDGEDDAEDEGGDDETEGDGEDDHVEGDVLAVGGRMTPLWVAGEPTFLPAEFYFLIGVTHRGFADGPGFVRNTNGSNLSFRAEVFDALGGFDVAVGGRKGDKQHQGGETELCARLRREYDTGVYYNPDAEVAHKIFAYRRDPTWLAKRAFLQGYSKRGMERFVTDSTDEEEEFLGRLVGEFIPDRVGSLVREPSVRKAEQLAALVTLTACVGVGYLYGVVKLR